MAIFRFFSRPNGVGAPLNIYMFTPRNISRHLQTLIANPRYFKSRIAVMAYQLWRPDAPWLTSESIRIISAFLTPDKIGLEWGSGRSTAWLARRLKHLVSIEHHPEWYAQVTEKLKHGGLSNVDYRLKSAVGTRPAYVSVADEFPDNYFDFILVDGECRNACLEAAVPKLRLGGLLILDNADQGYWAKQLDDLVYRPTDNGVWRTDVFSKSAIEPARTPHN